MQWQKRAIDRALKLITGFEDDEVEENFENVLKQK